MRLGVKACIGLAFMCGGLVEAYISARESFQPQPPQPSFFETMGWFFSGSDGWAIAAALFALFSALFSAYEVLKRDPMPREETRGRFKRVIRAIGVSDKRTQTGMGEIKAGQQEIRNLIEKDKIEWISHAIETKILSPNQFILIDKKINEHREFYNIMINNEGENA